MKKLMTLVLACALCLAGCGRRRLYSLNEVLVLEKECGEQELAQVVSGRDRAEIVDAWGEPDLKLRTCIHK